MRPLRRLQGKVSHTTTMAALSLPVILVICFVLCFPVCRTQQLQCNKGSLSILLKNNPKGLIKINCSIKPVTVSLVPDNDRCFTEGGVPLKIVLRTEWNAVEDKRPAEVRSKPAEYVVVEGSSYSVSDTNYLGKMQGLQAHQNNEFGCLLDNFYIGDNDRVYEGLGWDHFNYVRSGGINSLRIGFIKKSTEDPPSPSAIAIFKGLIKTAICLGKLTVNYKLIPSHYVMDYKHLEPTNFERKDLTKWERYQANTDLEKSDRSLGNFPLVFRKDWGAEPMKYEFYNYSSKIEFVVVGNSKSRCITTKQCILILKSEEKDFIEKKRDFPINFMFGEDGLAYEVFGWDKTWDSYWAGKNAIVVDFFGRYNSILPSKNAFHAFTRLMRFGVMLGKLSPDYKIVSIRKVYTAKHLIGEMLDLEIRKMDRFTDNF